MAPLPPSHRQLLLLSTMLFGMGYPSGQLGSSILSLTLPLHSNGCREERKAENGMWGFLSDSWDFSVLSGLLSTTPLSANRQVKHNLLQDLHTWAYWSVIHSTKRPSPKEFSCSRRDQEPGEGTQITRSWYSSHWWCVWPGILTGVHVSWIYFSQFIRSEYKKIDHLKSFVSDLDTYS